MVKAAFANVSATAISLAANSQVRLFFHFDHECFVVTFLAQEHREKDWVRVVQQGSPPPSNSMFPFDYLYVLYYSPMTASS